MPRPEVNTRHLKRAMLSAMEQSLGIVSTAAKAVGISRDTHYKWMKKDPKYAAQIEAIGDVAKDFAESMLFKQMRAGAPASTIFYLKTKARDRGYIERKEVDLSTMGQPLVKPPIGWSDE